MTRKHDRSFAHAETALAEALASSEPDAAAASAAVADVIARDLSAVGRSGTALLTAVSALAAAATHAAGRSEAETAPAARGFMIGVMLFGGREEENRLAVITHAAGAYLKHALEAGGDVGSAARALAEGAASWAGECGLDPGIAASAAGRGAVEAAEDVNAPLGREVRRALTDRLVAGVPVALEEPAAHVG